MSSALAPMLQARDQRRLRIRLYHLAVEETDPPQQHGPVINIMPVGLLALADVLERRGHDVQVVHAGVEQRLDPDYSVAAELARERPDLVGIALHWHHQLGPVAKLLDELSDAPPVVIGGMTASAFAKELLERFPAASYVVRGDAEVPLLQLAAWLADGAGDLGQIPNLTYRSGGEIRENPLGYTAAQQDLDTMEFVRRDLLRRGELYNAQFARGGSGWNHAAVFYLGAGRGCSVDCEFCSGGRAGHAKLAGRKAPVYRSPARLVDDLRKLSAQGIDTACICFDPPGRSEAHYREVFEGVRKASVTIAMVFECYVPPSEAFIEEFAATFDQRRSLLSLSPTVQDEALRGRLLGKTYTNASLEAALGQCKARGIATTVYFALTPMESREQLDRSLQWQAELVRTYGCRVIHAPIEMEPLAPWAESMPGARKPFSAFLERHTTRSATLAGELGYAFEDADARVVRVSSALSSPRLYFARAMESSGQGLIDRQVVIGRGEWERAAGMLERWRGRIMTVLTLDRPGASSDWQHVETLSSRLGARVRVIGVGPGVAKHAAWNGQPVARAPADAVVLLHLEGEQAARAMFETGALEQLPAGAVLAERCRWGSGPCPGREPRMLSFAGGAVRCCASSPDLGSSWEAIEQTLRDRMQEVEERRGCAQCEVRESCPRCLYTGSIPEPAYCELRRRFAAGGDRSIRLIGEADGWGISVGWDD